MWETIDPDGRPVVLSRGAWRHILETHAELGVPADAVLEVVSNPDRRAPGRDSAELWFYKAGKGPSHWIKVVVTTSVVAAGSRRLPSEDVSMSVTIAGVEFDHVVYDREADVLYLQVGSPPQAAADFDASPEGHYLRYDQRGALMGITIVNARAIFQREGKIPITLPEHRVEANDLEGVLTAA